MFTLEVNTDRDIIVFLDADFSEDPAEITALIDPIMKGDADLVLGHRRGDGRPWHARLGTALCVELINRLWAVRYQDLGPFRAIRRASLERLAIADQAWGWTIEMQVKGKSSPCPVVALGAGRGRGTTPRGRAEGRLAV